METHRLYYEDAYLTSFDARVTEVREGGWIALDRSAFYPTSGGQPYDTGRLAWDGGETRVIDVEAENGVVWHRTEQAAPLGASVRGEIDWDRRLDHMQQHAGDHMLAGAAWQLFGGVTIGLHLGRADSTIDLDMPEGRTHLTADETEALETLVNRRVMADDPIRCWFPTDAELAALPLRKKPTVERHVRVVAMGDYEMVACGGTHPRTTGQIGPIKIVSTGPARGKMRLCFVAGMRAYRYFQAAARCAEAVAAQVSAPLNDAPAALARDREEQRIQCRELEERLLTAALEALRAGRQGELYAGHLPYADPALLLRAAGELTKEGKAAALLSCPGKAGCSLVFARGKDAEADMAALLRSSGARGGGKPDMAQGSAPDGEALEKAIAAFIRGVPPRTHPAEQI